MKGIVLNTVWLRWSEADKELMQQELAGVDLTFKDEESLSESDFADTDFLLGNPKVETLTHFQKLRWLQLQSAGADTYTHATNFPEQLTLTNATGTYGLTISEHMIGSTLMLQRKLQHYYDNQHAELWQSKGDIQSIYGSSVLVLGLGDIGTEFAKKVKALGAHTIGVKRHIYGDEEGIDELYTSEKLEELLPTADIIACSLPSTPETRKIFGAEQFAKMKKSAIFINVGRGDAVDLDALCQALNEDKLGGAALDVTAPEPLPKGHPAWQTKNLLITPHISGGYTLKWTKGRFLEIFLENVRRFNAGEPLRNVVDFETGYRKK